MLRSMVRYFFLICFISFTSSAICQIKRANHWFFGHEVSISFDNGTPVSNRASSLVSIEGASSMSDTSGNLLFYTNGVTVWNKNHEIMLRGESLKGDVSSVQSSLCVPAPGSDSLFYIFTTGNDSQPHFSYSLVDMSKNNGLGEVVNGYKNIFLNDFSTECQAGIYHCDGDSYWIVTLRKKEGVLEFCSYVLNKDGVCGPTIQKISHDDKGGRRRHIRFSPSGDKITFHVPDYGIFLCDFDKKYGSITVTDTIPLAYPKETIYSASFSPDNQKLFTTSWFYIPPQQSYNFLSQFDLTAEDIAASRVNLDSIDFTDGSGNGFGYIGQIQLAPDQKIYVSRWNQERAYQLEPDTPYSLDSLDVINFPNAKGISAGYQRNVVYLKGKPTELGLPNFIESYFDFDGNNSAPCTQFEIVADFTIEEPCKNQNFIFTNQSVLDTNDSYSFYWNFGDLSAFDNLSRTENPIHRFDDPGIYEVTLVVQSNIDCKTDTVRKQITVSKSIFDVFPNDTTACSSESLLLEVKIPDATFLWSDGSTASSLQISREGVYWVDISLGQCLAREYVNVLFGDNPLVNLGNDTIFCLDDIFVLDATFPNATYLWQDGSKEPTFAAGVSGIYWVAVSLNQCTVIDSIQLTQQDCTIIIELPNVITPNQDEINDYFSPKKLDGVRLMYTKIYNRWGVEVFETDDININWYGTSKTGEELPIGVYFYAIKYLTLRDEWKSLNGTISILK
ncbi:MAG: gliding motility-associated C-terminal domain-containing protein [Microscillaceae bacterium]|nr:gliding motility-associated C-terminal domain-containing protein [Microscillaceae bacterium]